MSHASRRSFLKKLGATAAALGLSPWSLESMLQAQTTSPTQPARPASGQAKMIATWNHGIDCNAAGFLALQQGGGAMDMVEAGARMDGVGHELDD